MAEVEAGAARRDPTWSGFVTRPMARMIPASLRYEALTAINALHTALCLSIGAALVLTLWVDAFADLVRQHGRDAYRLAAAIVGPEDASRRDPTTELSSVRTRGAC